MPAPIQVAPSISRGMSWRKPVPVFIPTPPASRPTSGTSFIPASMFSGGDADNCPTAGAPLDNPPPMPDNWRSKFGVTALDVKDDNNPPQREASPAPAFHEPVPVYAELARSASSMTDDRRSHSSRSHYMCRGTLPKNYRPPTPPIPSSRRPRSVAVPGMLESQTSIGHHRPYRVIFPDPPTVLMKDSHQALCMSERTRLPVSVTHKPSMQSLTSSSDHTAVSSHAELGSWYLPDDLRAEWNLELTFGQRSDKRTVTGNRGATGQPELPMHYIPVSRLRKTQKERSCSGMICGAMACIGRAISSLFQTNTVESGAARN